MDLINQLYTFEFWVETGFTARLLKSIVIIAGLSLLYYTVKRLVRHQTDDPQVRYTWRTAMLYLLWIIGILWMGRIWSYGVSSVLTVLGIVAAGLTISHKEFLMSITAWGVNLWRGLFEVGDRVQVAQYRGDVIGVGVFFFTLMEVSEPSQGEQSTGRMVKVPNYLFLVHPLINYTRSFPFIWQEINILIRPDCDWQKAKYLMHNVLLELVAKNVEPAQKALKRISDEVIVFRNLNPKIYVKAVQTSPSGFLLTARFLAEPRSRRNHEMEIWEKMLILFRENGINLTFSGWELNMKTNFDEQNLNPFK